MFRPSWPWFARLFGLVSAIPLTKKKKEDGLFNTFKALNKFLLMWAEDGVSLQGGHGFDLLSM